MTGGSVLHAEAGLRTKRDDPVAPAVVLERLGREMGGRWTGVRFDYDQIPPGHQVRTPMPLCAALKAGFSRQLVLPVSLVSCTGALRSLGMITSDKDVVGRIHENTHLPVASIARAVKATPHLIDPVVSVTIGRDIVYDVAVGYASPASVMDVVRRWQGIHGDPLEGCVSTFMAICGNAVAAAHESGRVRISLGCPTSRGNGVLRKGEMVIAIPRRLLRSLYPDEER